VRILIADDHQLVRDGVKHMLSYEEDLEVVGEAEDGREAVELCRRLEPDLVLMDVRMPEMDGLEATRAIKEVQPSVAVLVVTTYENPNYLLEAIKAGAAGYVLKDAPTEQLLGAVRRVLRGESPLNQELAVQVIRRLVEETERRAEPSPAPGRGAARTPPLRELTPRELDVLRLLGRGKSNPEIAHELFISEATVKVHVHRIMRKLGVSDRTQAALRAVELGLVTRETGRKNV
jgi:DNA-binding NarL/FixJ family response regulator